MAVKIININKNMLNLIFKKIILFLIKFYQITLSLDHGFFKWLKPHGQCKFYPTCSVYSYSAIEKYGVIKGGYLSLKRLSRCHPWSKGGYDPLK